MRIRGFLWLGVGLWWLLSAPCAVAQLEIELTQGVDSAIPVAVLPFANEPTDIPGHTSLSQVIKSDLQNSGQFRVITPGVMDPKPVDVADVKTAFWKKKGANDLLIGQVKALPFGRYRVSFSLMDLYAKGADSSKAGDVAQHLLLQQTFRAKGANLRVLAHHISDAIYQKLTGTRGVFSTKIAYILVQNTPGRPTQYSLMVADADGFHPLPLLSSPMPIMSPAWAPSGRKIAYVSFEGDRAAVYIQNVITGARQLLSQFPGINGAPAFSPDGKKIALVLTRTGNPKIYVMDLATRDLTQITQGYSIDTKPAWAPDGKSLLFTSSRGGNPQVYQYVFSSKHVQRVTFDGNYNARASFMPDEQGIVMMHRDQGLFGIARQNLVSGRTDVLTQSGGDESPSLSPNGKMVIYATQYGGRGVLAVVSTDGYIKLRLPAQNGSVQEPSWSPFIG